MSTALGQEEDKGSKHFLSRKHGPRATRKANSAGPSRAQQQPSFVQAVNGAFGGRLVPVPGGVLVRDAGGALIAAVGVSGDNSDNDEAAGVAGIEASGLTAETG